MSDDAFRWIPGRGPDLAAVARLRRAFPKPRAPMGEAWFMSAARRTFDDFFAQPVAELPTDAFDAFLFELTSGIHSFGDTGGEWSEWFGYCLPDLIVRAHESHAFTSLFEPTISAFMNVYWPSELPPIYATFATDIYSTLGQCLMKPELWIDRTTPGLGTILGIRGQSSDALFWGRTSGGFSAAMFFALRYFPIEALPDWIDSLLEILHPAWQARFVTWLWGLLPCCVIPALRFTICTAANHRLAGTTPIVSARPS